MRTDMERKLYQYGKESRRMTAPGQNAEMLRLMEHAKKYESYNGMSCFVLTNIGMTGKCCILWQALWLGVFLLAEMSGQITRSGFEVLLSILPPLLVVLTADNISRIYNRSMLEIECTTKYSVTQIVMLRMSILTFSNYVIVLAGILIIHSGVNAQLTELLLYGFTPMILSEAILLELMRFIKGEELKTAGFVLYAVIVGASIIMKRQIWNAYITEDIRIWLLILMCGIVWTVVGFIRLGKDLSNYGIGHKAYYKEL